MTSLSEGDFSVRWCRSRTALVAVGRPLSSARLCAERVGESAG